MGRIVVGVDGSAPSQQALAWAADEAAARDSELLVVQSWYEPLLDGAGMAGAYRFDEVLARAKDELESVAQATRDSHQSVDVRSVLAAGPPAQVVLDKAEDAELVVLGARGSGGFLGLELGSVSSKVARRSPAPLVVVRGEAERAANDEVVVGVDGSECSRRALRWAAAWATAHRKSLVAVLAWDYLDPEGPDGPEAFRPDYRETDAVDAVRSIVADVLGEEPGLPVRTEAVLDRPAAAVLDRSTEACLVVVGRHGVSRWTLPGLGATASQVLRHAPCPVAVIPEG